LEAKELVFSSVENLVYPMLLVDDKDEKFVGLYANVAMKALVPEGNVLHIEEPLLEILKEYSNQENKDSYVLYDVEIFNGLFTLYLSQSSMGVGILFIQTPASDILNSLTFKELSKSCGAITVVLDEKGEILDTNNCFLDLVGFKKEDVIHKGFFQTFIPGDIEKLGKYFENILADNAYHQHFMTPLIGKGKELYKINWQVTKVVKQSQTYIIAIGSDVSKLFKENRNLRQQLDSIQVGFEYFPFSVGYMNGDGEFIKMNARFKKMFGIPESKVRVSFDAIPLLKKNIGFAYLEENIKFVKEMKHLIDYEHQGKHTKLRVNVRIIKGKKESSKLYIVVVQKER
jgi:PAS domain S-box-containing protein